MDEDYNLLRNEVDKLAERLSGYYFRHLVCGAGCSGCCGHNISVFEVEADAVRDAIERMPEELKGRIEKQAAEVRQRESIDLPVVCPMLVDDLCSIYESRPLICRTQGLPLLIEADDGLQEVDFCPLNFTEEDAVNDLDEDHLVPLEAINMQLVAINIRHCAVRNIDSARFAERLKMSEIIASASDSDHD